MKSPSSAEYWNPSVTVDVVIFTIEDDALKVLLIKRSNTPFQGKLALPGGFIHEGETSRDAATRVLKDKAGVENVYIEQLYTFDALDRDPRGQVLSVTYVALVPRDKIHIRHSPSIESPEFIDTNNLPALAFDHTAITAYALKRIQDKVQYTNIVYSLLPKHFTLSELQKTYETIGGKKIDKRNFRKKYLQLGLIQPTKKKSTGGRQRPALLYAFKQKSIAELRKFF